MLINLCLEPEDANPLDLRPPHHPGLRHLPSAIDGNRMRIAHVFSFLQIHHLQHPLLNFFPPLVFNNFRYLSFRPMTIFSSFFSGEPSLRVIPSSLAACCLSVSGKEGGLLSCLKESTACCSVHLQMPSCLFVLI